jgi:hypothetical protein
MTPLETIRLALIRTAPADVDISRELEAMGEADWQMLADACEVTAPTLSERRQLIGELRSE